MNYDKSRVRESIVRGNPNKNTPTVAGTPLGLRSGQVVRFISSSYAPKGTIGKVKADSIEYYDRNGSRQTVKVPEPEAHIEMATHPQTADIVRRKSDGRSCVIKRNVKKKGARIITLEGESNEYQPCDFSILDVFQ